MNALTHGSRAYAQQRHDAAAVNMLVRAEQTAPQLVRYDAARIRVPELAWTILRAIR
jgi:hypothetical protein